MTCVHTWPIVIRGLKYALMSCSTPSFFITRMGYPTVESEWPSYGWNLPGRIVSMHMHRSLARHGADQVASTKDLPFRALRQQAHCSLPLQTNQTQASSCVPALHITRPLSIISNPFLRSSHPHFAHYPSPTPKTHSDPNPTHLCSFQTPPASHMALIPHL